MTLKDHCKQVGTELLHGYKRDALPSIFLFTIYTYHTVIPVKKKTCNKIKLPTVHLVNFFWSHTRGICSKVVLEKDTGFT